LKLSFDPKFLGTALLISLVLLIVVSIVNALAGTAAATVVGGLLAALSVKLFDKLDFHPSEEIQFGAPLISVPWLYSALASALMLYGTRLGADIFADLVSPTVKSGTCGASIVVGLIAVDWGGFAVGGWLIGRIFPARALGLSSLAFTVLFIEWWLAVRGITPDSLSWAQKCIIGAAPTPEELPTLLADFRTGTLVGLILRGFLTVVVARIASRSTTTVLSKPLSAD
jgi:hypothetical protein